MASPNPKRCALWTQGVSGPLPLQIRLCFAHPHRDGRFVGLLLREFRAKANEIGALPNETICLTVFSLIVGRYQARRNRDKNNRFPVAKTSPD